MWLEDLLVAMIATQMSASCATRQDPEPPEPAQATPIPKAKPEPPVQSAKPVQTAKAEPSYLDRNQVTPSRQSELLANLEALKNEDLQAEKNPALWKVIRAVRAQMATRAPSRATPKSCSWTSPSPRWTRRRAPPFRPNCC